MDGERHPSSLSSVCMCYFDLRCYALAIRYGMDRLGNILNIPVIQSGKADPTISGKVNSVLGCELIAHIT
jgi:hypothetical protein